MYFPHRIRSKQKREKSESQAPHRRFGPSVRPVVWDPVGTSALPERLHFCAEAKGCKAYTSCQQHLLSRAFGLPRHTQPIKGYATMAPQEFVQFLSNSSNAKNQCKVQRVHYLHHVLITASLSIAQMESHHNGTRSCYRPAHARNMNLNNYLPLEGKGRALGFQGQLWCHESKSYSFHPVACLHGCTLGLSRTFTPTLKQAWLPPWCAYWLSYKRFGHGLLPAKGVFFQKYRLKLRRILEELHGFESEFVQKCSSVSLHFSLDHEERPRPETGSARSVRSTMLLCCVALLLRPDCRRAGKSGGLQGLGLTKGVTCMTATLNKAKGTMLGESIVWVRLAARRVNFRAEMTRLRKLHLPDCKTHSSHSVQQEMDGLNESMPNRKFI